jgi:hypothetical protein
MEHNLRWFRLGNGLEPERHTHTNQVCICDSKLIKFKAKFGNAMKKYAIWKCELHHKKKQARTAGLSCLNSGLI